MKKILSFLFVLVMPVVLMSQAVIVFENKVHDFGKIKEEDGRVSSVFTFTNRGNAPLVISKVQASCGCATPEWTKNPVEPGQKGTITVTYNPAGRPGNFSKNVSVMSNATTGRENLTIKGQVIPKANIVSKNEGFPIVIENIRLESKSVEFNNIEKGTVKEQKIKVRNASNEEVNISFANLPAYVSAKLSDVVLAANAESVLIFVFDSKKCPVWGPLSDDVYLVLNNKKQNSDSHKITLNANVIEDFSKMTLDQKRNAPILEISKRVIQLGPLKTSARQEGSFSVKNIGEKTLEIRRIINNNKEIILNHERMSVRGGKTATIKFSLNPVELKPGKYKRAITLQTNDPENVYVVLSIEWEIINN